MTYIDDIHFPQVPSAVTCRTAGIDAGTLKNWICRKPAAVLLTNEERAKAGQSTRFAFTINRVTQITITAELVRLGLGPKAAALIAAGFTDAGDGPLPGAPKRNPGGLFETGQTLLAAYPETEVGYVFNVSPQETWRQVLHRHVHSTPSSIIIDMNWIVWHVRRGLGMPINSQMEAA
jgi:hypothetical protein